MPRLTNLDQVLFPIVQEPLLSERRDAPGLRQIPSHSAIINPGNGRVLGVVSRAYGVVTNAQALDLGKRCCRELLGVGEGERLVVFNVDAPSTGTHCHIDLMHPAHAMNLLGNGQAPEVYVPYVRVTNSYNATRALRFDVGFCRKLCNNGVVFESETIRFRYPHLRGEAEPGAIQFHIRDSQLERLAARFRRFIAQARSLALDDEESRAIVRRVLGIPREPAITEQETGRRRLQRLRILEVAHECMGRYRAELGPNAYAVFNAMTELARTLNGMPGMFRNMDSMQKLAGEWLARVRRFEPQAREGRWAA